MKELSLKIFGWIAVFLAPIKASMLTIIVLVLVDLITGLLAAKKQGIPIISTKLGHTVIKLLGYEIAVLLAYTGQTYLLDGVPVIHVVAGFVGSTELLSIYENMSVITGTPYIDAIKKLLGRQDTLPPTPPTG